MRATSATRQRSWWRGMPSRDRQNPSSSMMFTFLTDSPSSSLSPSLSRARVLHFLTSLLLSVRREPRASITSRSLRLVKSSRGLHRDRINLDKSAARKLLDSVTHARGQWLCREIREVHLHRTHMNICDACVSLLLPQKSQNWSLSQ